MKNVFRLLALSLILSLLLTLLPCTSLAAIKSDIRTDRPLKVGVPPDEDGYITINGVRVKPNVTKDGQSIITIYTLRNVLYAQFLAASVPGLSTDDFEIVGDELVYNDAINMTIAGGFVRFVTADGKEYRFNRSSVRLRDVEGETFSFAGSGKTLEVNMGSVIFPTNTNPTWNPEPMELGTELGKLQLQKDCDSIGAKIGLNENNSVATVLGFLEQLRKEALIYFKDNNITDYDLSFIDRLIKYLKGEAETITEDDLKALEALSDKIMFEKIAAGALENANITAANSNVNNEEEDECGGDICA